MLRPLPRWVSSQPAVATTLFNETARKPWSANINSQVTYARTRGSSLDLGSPPQILILSSHQQRIGFLEDGVRVRGGVNGVA